MSQHHGPVIEIASRDFWFKVVEMLQQNWALVDDGPGEGVTVHFLHDGSGVFDRMEFPSHPNGPIYSSGRFWT